jgi:hypothetical protein
MKKKETTATPTDPVASAQAYKRNTRKGIGTGPLVSRSELAKRITDGTSDNSKRREPGKASDPVEDRVNSIVAMYCMLQATSPKGKAPTYYDVDKELGLTKGQTGLMVYRYPELVRRARLLLAAQSAEVLGLELLRAKNVAGAALAEAVCKLRERVNEDDIKTTELEKITRLLKDVVRDFQEEGENDRKNNEQSAEHSEQLSEILDRLDHIPKFVEAIDV